MNNKSLLIFSLDLDFSRKLFLKIYPCEQLASKIENYIYKNSFITKLFLNFCCKGKWELCLKLNPMLKLSLVYSFLPTVWNRYKEKGIEEEIFFDTMSDIKIWIDDYKNRTGKDGLYELNWIMHHMNLNLFKIGRLQFQKFFYHFKEPVKNGADETSFGNKVLFVHIPRGEKLDEKECEKSFEKAKIFFEKYYSDYPSYKFFCHSWLLYSGNKKFMKDSSNILHFARLFSIIKEEEYPKAAYLYIFGIEKKNQALMKAKKISGKYSDTASLPQNSSLQKSAVKHILNGGTLGEALGVRFIKNNPLP